MGEPARIAIKDIKRTPSSAATSNLVDKLKGDRSDELVFAVVGYAGSGTSFVAERLGRSLSKLGHNVHKIKARQFLDAFAAKINRTKEIAEAMALKKTEIYQELGDKLRETSQEYGIIAGYMVREIRRYRKTAPKDGKRNIYILDSIKHPSEISLLRHVYGANFFLLGIGCRPDTRRKRLQEKYSIDDTDAKEISILDDFVNRDAEDSEHKYGQQVNDSFHLSDYFVDNTTNREDDRHFTLPDELKKLEDLVFRRSLYRPTDNEKGMYYATAAAMQSACLSRQVGASILDSGGNVIATGTNEVPRAGGGAYGQSSAHTDHRCFKEGYCANTRKQNEIIGEIYKRLNGDSLLSNGTNIDQVATSLKGSRVKSLIEFSRAVHAEMGALMSLVRSGTKLDSEATLFSTTYPCHNCARHIVAAGISRVVYLEPYAKSLAINLHADSIADNLPPEEIGDRVVFQPYQGVSPRLYAEAFLKRGDLKDNKTGDFIFDSNSHIRSSEHALWNKTYDEFEEVVEDYINSIEVSDHVD
ncbi:MAG: hypothetical protein KGJ54_07335 [Betaproteobacteria bacterium]|nr:hypothetical protein [Betaproteobacteria bacterium]